MDEKYMELAGDLELRQREVAQAEAARLSARQHHPDFDGKHCIACDDEIPAGRLELGRIYCVHCQEEKERRDANTRRKA